LKQGRWCQAKQRKEAWDKYESNLAEYNKRKSEQEAEDKCAARKTHNSLYAKIQELVEEYEAISHPNEEQERLREILRSTALRMQDGKTHLKQPARIVS
jgi:tRNA C32,U32 (ribose-2'-O)-methylase TrmJ